MSEYKIVVIEPDDDFRETLELLLNYSFEFEVIGLFKKCSAIKPGRSLNPGIVLAGITEISELAKIQKLFSQTPVVAITTDETDKNIVKLLASGAAHYIFKGSEPAVYLSTLKEVVTNNIKIRDSVIKKVLDPVNTAGITGGQDVDLTSREKEILRMLARGTTYKTISDQLFISLETVKTHCHNIYKKLGVKNKTEAINKVLRS